MDFTSCLCAVAAALLFFFCGVWRLKRARSPAVLAVLAVLGASLCVSVPPLVCSSVLIVLIVLIDRTDDLLLPAAAESRAVLITGCDSGFGQVLALRLSELGLTVFAGVLDVNAVGAQRLRGTERENLQVLQLDVTDSSQIETARRYICRQVSHTGLWGLVNNAGVLFCPADAELQPMATYRRCLDVNFLAAVKMCQEFLPLLRKSRGRIVNVSSMAGEVPLPMFGAYGASKAALSVFSRVLRLELSVWGVKVSLIQPAGFRTNIFGNRDDATRYRDELLAAASSEAREDYGEAYISSLPGSLSKMSQHVAQDLSPVVEDMCHALLSPRPKAMYTPGRMAWLLPCLQRCCPTAMFDAIITLMKNTDRRPAGLSRS
ncbi:17-beta-hydroxysteroid dehydrogenase type 2 [Symphorus nematophorus]